MKKLDLSSARWLNKPRVSTVGAASVSIVTDPKTDFWQRSYYGFRNDNGHALLLESADNFTFTARTSFECHARFDQCGLIVYLDSDNWFKASMEFEDKRYSRLGSVVTNSGYSDWATTDIPTASTIWYRLSRRGPDFLVESSLDGRDFRQMRIFHLHPLGVTSAEMGRLDPPAPSGRAIPFGVYACSPLDSSFEARFDNLSLVDCQWKAHRNE